MTKKLIEQQLDLKVLSSVLATFSVQLWKQGKFYYLFIRTDNAQLSPLYYPQQPADRFATLAKAKKAFGRVMIREDGMAVTGHSYGDEG